MKPDLNIDIKNGDVVLYDSNVLDDKISDQNCTDTFDFYPNLTLTSLDFNSLLNFRLYDYDGTLGYQFMGSQSKIIYSSTTGFPTTLIIGDCITNSVVIELTLSYLW